MITTTPFNAAQHYKPAVTGTHRGVLMAAEFASLATDYEAATTRAALFDRSHRGLLAAVGPDAKTWLHNMVTNAVKTLDNNAGNYAFAIDVKGRTQFDLNILVLPDRLWLDIDAATVAAAQSHLERFLITEKVELREVSADFARIGVAGPQSSAVAAALGVGNMAAMASLSSTWLADGVTRIMRHDFAGQAGFELIVPARDAVSWWDRLAGECGVTPAGYAASEALRIEAGIPAWGSDIDDKTIPPETGQIERGISYNKGCYLGQEVIERMRSLGAPARRLMKLSISDGEGLSAPSPIVQNGQDVGRITSLARHPLRADWLGLGYVRANIARADGLTAGDPPRALALR